MYSSINQKARKAVAGITMESQALSPKEFKSLDYLTLYTGSDLVGCISVAQSGRKCRRACSGSRGPIVRAVRSAVGAGDPRPTGAPGLLTPFTAVVHVQSTPVPVPIASAQSMERRVECTSRGAARPLAALRGHAGRQNRIAVAAADAEPETQLKNGNAFVTHQECGINGAILNVLSEPITISKGVPQGSILGPLLFILYVNNLKESLNKYSPCQFADDTSCIAIGKDLHTTSAEALDAISKMYKYCEAQFLELNMNKTLVVQYRNGPMSSSIYIKLGTKSVPLADEVKFLGLYIDKALKFNAHSNYVCRKLAKYSYIIRNLRTSLISAAAAWRPQIWNRHTSGLACRRDPDPRACSGKAFPYSCSPGTSSSLAMHKDKAGSAIRRISAERRISKESIAAAIQRR
ncbi:hypothetical protein TcasGA2_TC031104 [Tribolium castaneum]|uniref:Reverse transcriptase domain-containing protein n=1 Tax=Tribolium castaneum TaxID=7070 RepID=A0A139WJF2_TRICA|nr:hypothetical protein TcasGA2_TC031104 [Tribolium castaneum]